MRTFIVRLMEDAGGGHTPGAVSPRLRGVVDEVATGLRATFRDDTELLTALTAAMAGEPADGEPASSSQRPVKTHKENHQCHAPDLP
jgi:hypothetical protein